MLQSVKEQRDRLRVEYAEYLISKLEVMSDEQFDAIVGLEQDYGPEQNFYTSRPYVALRRPDEIISGEAPFDQLGGTARERCLNALALAHNGLWIEACYYEGLELDLEKILVRKAPEPSDP